MGFFSFAGLARGALTLLPLLKAVPADAAPSLAEGFSAALTERADDNHWVATWASMPQLVESSNMPPSSFVCTSTRSDNRRIS